MYNILEIKNKCLGILIITETNIIFLNGELQKQFEKVVTKKDIPLVVTPALKLSLNQSMNITKFNAEMSKLQFIQQFNCYQTFIVIDAIQLNDSRIKHYKNKLSKIAKERR